jgi:CRISPR-associated exonuclease Cas4
VGGGVIASSSDSSRAPFDEDALLPISALQHLLFCERQCALIHIEGLWAENRLTVEGRHLHERTDSGISELRDGVRTARSLSIRSLRLGLVGRADIVELHVDAGGRVQHAVPVEYKRGRPKGDDSDRVQLCAQAMCLEEMLCLTIAEGALYYGQTRRRTAVSFDAALRAVTMRAGGRLHAMVQGGVTPPAVRMAKCDKCSLVELCLPAPPSGRRSAQRFTAAALAASLADDLFSESAAGGEPR